MTGRASGQREIADLSEGALQKTGIEREAPHGAAPLERLLRIERSNAKQGVGGEFTWCGVRHIDRGLDFSRRKRPPRNRQAWRG